MGWQNYHWHPIDSPRKRETKQRPIREAKFPYFSNESRTDPINWRQEMLSDIERKRLYVFWHSQTFEKRDKKSQCADKAVGRRELDAKGAVVKRFQQGVFHQE